MCLTSRMELTGWYCRDQDVTNTMCLTSRMELTGWYCRDQDVTKPWSYYTYGVNWMVLS